MCGLAQCQTWDWSQPRVEVGNGVETPVSGQGIAFDGQTVEAVGLIETKSNNLGG